MVGTILCGDCGAPMKEYDLYEPDTFEVVDTHIVCPNQWRQTHE